MKGTKRGPRRLRLDVLATDSAQRVAVLQAHRTARVRLGDATRRCLGPCGRVRLGDGRLLPGAPAEGGGVDALELLHAIDEVGEEGPLDGGVAEPAEGELQEDAHAFAALQV